MFNFPRSAATSSAMPVGDSGRSMSAVWHEHQDSESTLSRAGGHDVGPLGYPRPRSPRAAPAREGTDLSVERLAADVGFGSATVLREHFGQIVGTSPLAYRSAFKVI